MGGRGEGVISKKKKEAQKLKGSDWNTLTHIYNHVQNPGAFTCSLRLKVNVSSASGKSSSFTAMKMVLLDSVDNKKAAALLASKSPVSGPSS